MIMTYKNTRPIFGAGSYVAPTAVVIGDVVMGAESSVWFNAVVRGDVNSIRIGKRTNVQDGSVLHVTTEFFPLTIGDEVTIGHRAVVHGATVGNRVLIGMGAVILDGATIGDDSVVAAGCVVPEGAEFPPRSLIMGVPAKKVRTLNDSDVSRILDGPINYEKSVKSYLAGDAVDITVQDA